MTDEELIARLVSDLRIKSAMINMGEKIAFGSETVLMDAAANCIEDLVQERDGMLRCVTDNHEANKRAEAAEAKVARLVDGLVFYANPEIYKPHPHGLGFDRSDQSYKARALLAEIKGETK